MALSISGSLPIIHSSQGVLLYRYQTFITPPSDVFFGSSKKSAPKSLSLLAFIMMAFSVLVGNACAPTQQFSWPQFSTPVPSTPKPQAKPTMPAAKATPTPKPKEESFEEQIARARAEARAKYEEERKAKQKAEEETKAKAREESLALEEIEPKTRKLRVCKADAGQDPEWRTCHREAMSERKFHRLLREGAPEPIYLYTLTDYQFTGWEAAEKALQDTTEFDDPEVLAAFKSIGEHPKLHKAVRRLAYYAIDWRNRHGHNPKPGSESPAYRAGKIAYSLLSSARRMDSEVVEKQNPKDNFWGRNQGDGAFIEVDSVGDEGRVMATLIHEFGHNRIINGVDINDGVEKNPVNSVEEEATNEWLAETVVAGMNGRQGRNWHMWQRISHTDPGFRYYFAFFPVKQNGYLSNMEKALDIDIDENGTIGT